MTYNFNNDKTFLKTLKVSAIDYTDKITCGSDIDTIKQKCKNDKSYKNILVMIDYGKLYQAGNYDVIEFIDRNHIQRDVIEYNFRGRYTMFARRIPLSNIVLKDWIHIKQKVSCEVCGECVDYADCMPCNNCIYRCCNPCFQKAIKAKQQMGKLDGNCFNCRSTLTLFETK